jgi:hypothetical protein
VVVMRLWPRVRWTPARFDPAMSLSENIRREILGPASVALSEVELLLSDEVRDIRTYLTVLNAIGEGRMRSRRSRMRLSQRRRT